MKTPFNQKEKAKLILENLENNLLLDDSGDYNRNEALAKAFEKQNSVLKFHQLALESKHIRRNCKAKRNFNPEQVRSSIARRLSMNISGLISAHRDVEGIKRFALWFLQKKNVTYHLTITNLSYS